MVAFVAVDGQISPPQDAGVDVVEADATLEDCAGSMDIVDTLVDPVDVRSSSLVLEDVPVDD